MASGVYDRAKANWMNKVTDFEADTIKVMLLDDSHSFVASHATVVDVVANEISGTGYTASGAELDNKSVTEGATTKFDADDEVWTGSTFTAHHAVIFDVTAADNLIASIDFGGAKVVSSGSFAIQWNASGIITIA